MTGRGQRAVRAAVATCIAGLALGASALPAAAAPPAGTSPRAGAQDPGVLVVQTVPPVPGARISADGKLARANSKGIARLPIDTFVDLEQRFNAPQTKVAKDRRVVLDRVRGQLHNAFNGKVIEVGLRTERLVRWTFTDRTGLPILPDRLTRVILRSSTGELLTLTGSDIGAPRWVAASRTQQTSNGLMSKDIYWNIQSVLMDGAELVNRSQQRFVPNETTQWTIRLLFYRAEVKSSDLLFGVPAGDGVQVTAPDGEVTRYPFDADGYVTMPAVPRGEYKMAVYGPGISFTRPVSVSKDQEVELMVVSDLDVALVVGVLLLIAISLLIVGRRHHISAWSGRRRAPGSRRRRRADSGDPAGSDPPADPEGSSAPEVGVLRALSCALVLGAALALAPAPPSHAATSLPAGAEEVTRKAGVAAAQASPIPVLAYYYIWFNPTSWKRAKIDYPLLGRYSSDDEVVMATHIQMAQEAGINGFLVSWKRTPQLNKRLASLAEAASATGFRLGIVYQGLDFSRNPVPIAQVVEDLDWLATTYGQHSTFRAIDELPVVIWTGTEKFSTKDIARVAQAVRGRVHLLGSAKSVEEYKRIAPWVDGDAYYWSSVKPDMKGYPEKLQAMAKAVHDDGGLWIPPFAPGFDARLVGGASAVPRDGGETLRRELAAARGSDPDALGLISWNEFSENTHVEPSEEYGTSTLHALALALGATPPPAAADSGDEADGVAGVTGWGALVLLGLGVALLNLVVAVWRGGRRPTTSNSDYDIWEQPS
jgi:hypothetical protein